MNSLPYLVPVQEHLIGATPQQCVSARDLHGFLEVKTIYPNWINRRIEKYQFVENQDFIYTFQKRKALKTATIIKEYFITISMAKELCMVENNERGREARQYFINCEQKLGKAKEAILQMANDPIIGIRMKQIQIEQKVNEHDTRLDFIEAKITTKNEDYYTISGFASLHGWQVDRIEAAKYGRAASKLSRERGFEIKKEYDPKYGRVNMYHIVMLEETFEPTRKRKEKLLVQVEKYENMLITHFEQLKDKLK